MTKLLYAIIICSGILILSIIFYPLGDNGMSFFSTFFSNHYNLGEKIILLFINLWFVILGTGVIVSGVLPTSHNAKLLGVSSLAISFMVILLLIGLSLDASRIAGKTTSPATAPLSLIIGYLLWPTSVLLATIAHILLWIQRKSGR